MSDINSIENNKFKYYSQYTIKKILLLIVFLFVLSIIIFALSRLSPGDPLHAYYGDSVDRMTIEQKEAAISRLSLDEPMIKQYTTWLTNILSGDMGISYQYKQPVSDIISKYWFNTLLLGGISYVLTFVFAILLGVFCASRQGKIIDTIIRKVGTVTSVIPSFFLCLIFILIFAVNLNILPMGGAYSLGASENFFDRLVHLILPVLVMILSHLWYYTYIIRNKLIEEFAMDYVSLLKVKGASRSAIIWKHCMRNILPPLISIMAVSVPHIIGGTYIVEMVFAYPGLGTLSFESAMYHDYNMLSALCLITGAVVIVFNIIGEEVSEILDPRIKSLSFIISSGKETDNRDFCSSEKSKLKENESEANRKTKSKKMEVGSYD